MHQEYVGSNDFQKQNYAQFAVQINHYIACGQIDQEYVGSKNFTTKTTHNLQFKSSTT